MTHLDSYIFRVAARVVFALVSVLSLYLLLRGHNLPGGGFIGGLAAAIALILLSLALGVRELRKVIRMDPVRLAIAGLTLALLTSAGPMVFERPFLEQFMLHLKGVPLLGELHFGTTLLFDVGVFLVVVGVTCKIILLLATSTQGLKSLVKESKTHYSSPLEKPIEEQRRRNRGND